MLFKKSFSLSNAGLRCHSNHAKAGYQWYFPLQTRWKDNDKYGHVNNAVHHALYDTAINVYLMRFCHLNASLDSPGLIGFMVKNECQYLGPISYPQVYLSGLKVTKIGSSSVSYELGLFGLKSESEFPSLNFISGHFVKESNVLNKFSLESNLCIGKYTHVFVNPREGNKPTKIPEEMRKGLSNILVSES